MNVATEVGRRAEPAAAVAATTGVAPRLRREVYDAVEQAEVHLPLAHLMVGDELRIYPEVQGQDFFTIHLSGDRLIFRARGVIGLIPINDAVSIDVRPRVPVANLERLLSLSGTAPILLRGHMRGYSPHIVQPESLLDMLARSLVDTLVAIEARGGLRTYIVRLEDTSVPRGRVLHTQTMSRYAARGVLHRATASWFEPAIDNGPNRCIKYAIWALAHRYRTMAMASTNRRGICRQLTRLYNAFPGVALDRSRQFLTDKYVLEPGRLPSIRAYYAPALALASMIARNQGVALRGESGSIHLASLLLKLQDIFEGYIREVLSSNLRRIDPELEVLNGNTEGAAGGRRSLFDTRPSVFATPDVVVRCMSGLPRTVSVPLVVEIKYKPLGSGPDRDDLNQVIAYALSYRARAAVIVSPASSKGSGGLQLVGRIDRIGIYQYGYELGASDLRQEELNFSRCMARLAAILGSGAESCVAPGSAGA